MSSKGKILITMLLFVIVGALLVAGRTLMDGASQEQSDPEDVQMVFPETVTREDGAGQYNTMDDMENGYQVDRWNSDPEPLAVRAPSRVLSVSQRMSLLATALPMNDDPFLAELGLYEAVLGDGYRIFYNERIDHMHIQITRTPAPRYRDAAELMLADLLDVETRDLCSYSVSVSAPNLNNYGLSSCPRID